MQVTTEQIDPCKIALTITVEPEKVVAARERAFGQFARGLNLTLGLGPCAERRRGSNPLSPITLNKINLHAGIAQW